MDVKNKFTVMLIDDSSTNNILYQSILQDEGYNVITCQDGKIALKKLEKETPDLIMLDLMMPGMDGINFLEVVQTEIPNFKIPVIMLTAHSEFENKEKAFKLGVKEYMIKPAGINEITEKVKNILDATQK